MATTAPPASAPAVAPPAIITEAQGLVWSKVLEMPEPLNIRSIVAADDRFYFLAQDLDAGDTSPTMLWTSQGGTDWIERDVADLFGDGAVVSEITHGHPGLVAVGSMPSGAGEAVAWTSVDGEEWTVTPLGHTFPEPERPYEVPQLRISAMAAGPAGAVIAATPWVGFEHELLEPSVAAALPASLREFASDGGVTIDPWEIRVSVGPFDVFSEAVENLDVDQDLFDAYERSISADGADMVLFATDDYQTWRKVEDWPGSSERVVALAATAEGYLAAVSAWDAEPGPYASTDAIAWEEIELPADPGTIHWFGTTPDRLLMTGELGGRPAVWESGDGGSNWSLLTSLPDNTWDVRAGGIGLIALGSRAWLPSSNPEWTLTLVDSEGLTLSIEEGPDGCTVTGPEGKTLLTADVASTDHEPTGRALPSILASDHDRATFTVGDPDGDAPLMTVTYREMQDAYERALGPVDLDWEPFVVYSADGHAWSEQPILELTGATAVFGSVAVGNNAAVLFVHPHDGPSSLWRATTR